MPHIINILHLNKGDSNPRGHIGTELLNKADCTIELELDEKAGCTDVRCESSREKPFSKFSFTHDLNDLPAVVTNNASGELISPDDRKARLKMVFEDDYMLTRKQLIKNIREHFGVGENKAGYLIQEFRRMEWIMKIGADHDPTTKFKLTIPENGYQHTNPPAQQDLFGSTAPIESAAPSNSPDDVTADDLPF